MKDVRRFAEARLKHLQAMFALPTSETPGAGCKASLIAWSSDL
jgi:hypothetical protein